MGDNDIEAQEGRSPREDNTQSTATREKLLKLYRAAFDNNWDIAEEIYEKNQTEIKYYSEIARGNETALHIAVAAESVDFSEKLIEKMSDEDLALRNSAGNTAFCLAAVSGNVEIAEAMMKKKKDLAMTPGRQGMLPIYMAALMGQREMVCLLYGATKDQLKDDDKKNLFISLINSGIYDIAKEMLTENILLFTDQINGKTALHALAEKPSLPEKEQPGLWNKCIHLCTASKQDSEKNRTREAALHVVQRICKEVALHKDNENENSIKDRWSSIFTAAKNGNVEFLTILIHSYPDIILEVDENKHSIFHLAVLYRHQDIFKLIHKIGSFKTLIANSVDDEGNNILHLAANKPSDESRLHVLPGAALQMHLELLWFDEVKKIVHPQMHEGVNKEDFTPAALLRESHKELMKDGEEWMRGTANSCMVVATLIATVAFAAGFTVPGGNDQNGNPTFLRKAAFKAFSVTNGLSLITSVSSVLTFLSITTSRYVIDDFRESLPDKLILGLVTLLISIVAMLLAFSTAMFLVFDHGNNLIWYAIPIAAFASSPVILFGYQQRGLFVDVINSIHRSTSSFKPNKTPLFSDRVRPKRRKIRSKEE